MKKTEVQQNDEIKWSVGFNGSTGQTKISVKADMKGRETAMTYYRVSDRVMTWDKFDNKKEAIIPAIHANIKQLGINQDKVDIQMVAEKLKKDIESYY